MADLHNLLAEADNALNDEENLERETLDAEATQEGWDDHDREQLDLLAAMEEFRQKKYDDAEEEEDVDVEFEEDVMENEAECYYKLKRMWQQELACPELLPLDEDTVQEVREELEKRDEAISNLGDQSGDMEALLGSVLKVDSDRARFMLTDLLRIRLWKIQDHPLHMRDLVPRMSDSEVDFLKGYGKLLEGHLRRTVLDHVSKDALKNLDEPEMIDRPDLDTYVFVKVKETVEFNGGTEEAPVIQEHKAGMTLITRYSAVRELFGQGKVELVP